MAEGGHNQEGPIEPSATERAQGAQVHEAPVQTTETRHRFRNRVVAASSIAAAILAARYGILPGFSQESSSKASEQTNTSQTHEAPPPAPSTPTPDKSAESIPNAETEKPIDNAEVDTYASAMSGQIIEPV